MGLGFDASGRAVATWRGLIGGSADTARPFAAFSSTRLDGTWRPQRRFMTTVVAHELAMTGQQTAAIVASPTAGVITATSTTSRQIQFGLKVLF